MQNIIADLTHERDHYKRELGIATRMDQVARVSSMLGLSPKEGALLMTLYARAGRVLSKEICMSAMYNERDEPEIQIIDVFICKLRKKIGSECIDTLWARGYMLTQAGVEKVEKALRVEH